MIPLKNLMTFPFIKDAVDKGKPTLHGLWHDIKEGDLEQLDPWTGEFVLL